MSHRVAIVEDNDAVRGSLAQLIERTDGLFMVLTCRDGGEAIQRLPAMKPDVVLMDINLPKADGIECLRQLTPEMPETQFVMLTVHADDERIFESLRRGASGYMLKRASPEQIVAAVREAADGGAPMSSYIARRVIRTFAERPDNANRQEPLPSLSPREREVLTMLSRGDRFKEIAHHLDVSIETVRTHARRVYDKLHVRSRTEAVVKFLRSGG